MSVRVRLTAEVGAAMAPVLATLQSRPGRPPVVRERLLIEAGLSRARTGLPWRHLPQDFGRWDALDNRFRRWEVRGGWRRRGAHRQTAAGSRACPLFSDATLGRAQQHAAGALKTYGGQAAQSLGRSRGGLATTIQAGCRDARTGIAVVLTAGPCPESPGFAPVCAQGPPAPSLTQAMMDKA
jgi:transposase